MQIDPKYIKEFLTNDDLDECQKLLKCCRQEIGLSQTGFADLVGFSRGTLNYLESGKANLSRLECNAIKYVLSDLIYFKEVVI